MDQPYRPPFGGAKGIPRRAFLVSLATAPVLALGRETAAPRLPHDQPMLCRDRSGRPRPVRTRADWRRRRAEIRRGFEAVAGPLPGRERRCPLNFLIDEVTPHDGYSRCRVSYQTEPGQRLEAYLLIPHSTCRRGRCPAALCLHQTHPQGKRVVVGLGNSPDDEYGVELARRGFVCLAPPYPMLADYQPDLARLGYVSGTMKAIWDNRRALDVLASLPYVRRGPVAAIGHSLGGHNAIFTALLDDRIGVVVTSCAFDSFVDYRNGDLTGWTQTRYLPRLREYLGRPADVPFDFYELIAALAPRPVFASAPLGDTNFQWQSVARIAAAAEPVYALHHAADRLVVRHPDCAHRFPPEVREESYAFIEGHLGRRD